VQIIVNPFRPKPLDQVLPAAQAAGVSPFARVPLASGLLSGKYTATTTFAAGDHRTYNRAGEAFDRGETFSGVDLEVGLQAASRLVAALPPDVSLPAASRPGSLRGRGSRPSSRARAQSPRHSRTRTQEPCCPTGSTSTASTPWCARFTTTCCERRSTSIGRTAPTVLGKRHRHASARAVGGMS